MMYGMKNIYKYDIYEYDPRRPGVQFPMVMV